MNVEPSEFGTEGSDGSQNHGREGQPAIDAVLDDSLDNASDGHDDERDANDEVDLRECMGHREGDDGKEGRAGGERGRERKMGHCICLLSLLR